VKIPCKVNSKSALVVGYAPGRKGRPMAIVITEGMLRAVRLKDIILGELPDQLSAKVVKIKEASNG
jgi:hypothetical protein